MRKILVLLASVGLVVMLLVTAAPALADDYGPAKNGNFGGGVWTFSDDSWNHPTNDAPRFDWTDDNSGPRFIIPSHAGDRANINAAVGWYLSLEAESEVVPPMHQP